MRVKDFILCGCMCAVFGLPCYADIVTQWTFNTDDGNNTTGTTTPSTGSGTASLIGGTTGAFAAATADGNSTDPAADPLDSGWNVLTFPAQGTANETGGAQFTVSTAGFENITLTFDTRHAAAASRFMAVYYTTDGTNYTRFAVNSGNANPGMTPSGGAPGNTAGLFGGNGTFSAFDSTVTPVGNDWFNGRSVDFSSITAANNNPNFGVRLVSSFDSGSTYLSSGNTGGYNPAGAWRFDMVTIAGSPTAVPEASVVVFGSVLSVILGGAAYLRRKLS